MSDEERSRYIVGYKELPGGGSFFMGWEDVRRGDLGCREEFVAATVSVIAAAVVFG